MPEGLQVLGRRWRRVGRKRQEWCGGRRWRVGRRRQEWDGSGALLGGELLGEGQVTQVEEGLLLLLLLHDLRIVLGRNARFHLLVSGVEVGVAIAGIRQLQDREARTTARRAIEGPETD